SLFLASLDEVAAEHVKRNRRRNRRRRAATIGNEEPMRGRDGRGPCGDDVAVDRREARWRSDREQGARRVHRDLNSRAAASGGCARAAGRACSHHTQGLLLVPEIFYFRTRDRQRQAWSVVARQERRDQRSRRRAGETGVAVPSSGAKVWTR